jgi:hypothetical protein
LIIQSLELTQWRSQARRRRDISTNSVRWTHAMSIFASVILRGFTNLIFPCLCANAVAGQGNFSVEVLLPQGGHGRQLSCPGWSAVLGVDADGGSPDLDFTDEGDA